MTLNDYFMFLFIFSVANLFVHFMHDSTEFHHICKHVDM